MTMRSHGTMLNVIVLILAVTRLVRADYEYEDESVFLTDEERNTLDMVERAWIVFLVGGSGEEHENFNVHKLTFSNKS